MSGVMELVIVIGLIVWVVLVVLLLESRRQTAQIAKTQIYELFHAQHDIESTEAFWPIGSASYYEGRGYSGNPAGFYRITRYVQLEPNRIAVYGELAFSVVVSDCKGVQIEHWINHPKQCEHYWHHGPDRPAGENPQSLNKKMRISSRPEEKPYSQLYEEVAAEARSKRDKVIYCHTSHPCLHCNEGMGAKA